MHVSMATNWHRDSDLPARESASRSCTSVCIRPAASVIKSKMSTSPLGQVVPQIPAQQPAEGDQLPQRLLQVMAGDVGELLQLPIPIRQLSVESPLLVQLGEPGAFQFRSQSLPPDGVGE